MAQRASYHTRQLAEVEAFLQARPGRHVTAQEVCAHLRAEGVAIGATTVYRQLERLAAQGVVAKYTVEGSKSACYEYLGGPEHCHTPSCFHCKCEGCGKLIHLQCRELDALAPHLQAEHGFALDARRTVFYGLCPDCQAAR